MQSETVNFTWSAASRVTTNPVSAPPLIQKGPLSCGVALHESATNSVTWPAMPCYNNLVAFDQLKQLERPETIVPELAEK
jgi:hypothetical protein